MKNFILSHIAAASQNNVIGFRNKLPWDIPEDLKFFQKKTKEHVIIMGRKTFESLGRPLPKRTNIIVSKNKNFKPQGCFVFPDINLAIQEAKNRSEKDEIFIIGGGEIYRQSISKIQKIYLTRIHKEFKGDAFYPEIPKNQFQLTVQEDHSGSPSFSFLTYVRVP